MKTVREYMKQHRRKAGERRLEAWLETRRWCFTQGDQSIANQAGAAFRSDLNTELQALVTLSSGATAPATTYAHQLWADTTANVLKKRNAANSAWIVVRTLDETFVLSRSTNTILGLSDVGKTIVATAAFTQTLTAAATLGDGWWCAYNAQGNSIVLDPNASETIDNATTKTVTGSGLIFCNGSAFFTVGFALDAAIWLPGVISPTQIAANTDDWAPTGFSTASTIRISSDAARNLTGIAAGTNGRVICLHNVGAFTITLKDDVTSTAANRFQLNADYSLLADASVLLEYDSTSSRWRLFGQQAAGLSVFVSSAQTITAAGSLTIAHGLAGVPKMCWTYLKCTTAEFNYSINDIALMPIGTMNSSFGTSVVPDATNLNIRFGSNVNTYTLLNKTTGGGENLTNANWQVFFVAIY